MENRTALVPLTEYQRSLLALLARNRSPDSYLAGGAALHFPPHSARFSDDLDFFHDSSARVASAFAEDSAPLEGGGARDDSYVQPDTGVAARLSARASYMSGG